MNTGLQQAFDTSETEPRQLDLTPVEFRLLLLFVQNGGDVVSRAKILETVWGQTATSFDSSPESVLAFRGVKVSDFGGRSLSLLSSGTMAVDPDIPDAHRLKGWYPIRQLC